MTARSTRNTVLAAAAAGGVVAGCVLIAARSLYLSDILSASSTPFFSNAEPTYIKVSGVVGLAGAVALAAAFGLSWAAFLQDTRRVRVRMLAIAGFLFAAYGAAVFVQSLLGLIHAPSGEAWKFTASQVSSVGDGVALLVAALVIAVAVVSSRPARLLGWGCLALAGHYLLTACVYGLTLATLYDLTSPDARVLGYYIASMAGYLVAGSAAIKAAIAFATGGSRRDRELGVAAILFTAGFLMASGGLISTAVSGAGATIWLYVAYLFMLAVAAGVGAAAFFSSEQHHSPDVHALPDTSNATATP